MPGPAARAPGHGVVALDDPAALVAFGEEAPDEVVVLVAEREVAAAHLGHPKATDEHLDRVGDGAVRALDRRRPGQGASPRSSLRRRSSSGSFQSIQNPSRIDCSVCRAA